MPEYLGNNEFSTSQCYDDCTAFGTVNTTSGRSETVQNFYQLLHLIICNTPQKLFTI